MDKTDFTPDPVDAAAIVDWFRNVKSPADPMPSDVLWRLLVVMRDIDSRLSQHEDALHRVVRANCVHRWQHGFEAGTSKPVLICAKCGASPSKPTDVPHP